MCIFDFINYWPWTFAFILSLWLLSPRQISHSDLCACHQRELGTAPSLFSPSHSFDVTSSQLINIAHTKNSSRCLFSSQ